MGLNKTLVFLQFGKEFILQRKLFQMYFGSKESRDLISVQYQEAHVMVKKLIADPKDYVDILETFVAVLTLNHFIRLLKNVQFLYRNDHSNCVRLQAHRKA